VALDVEHAALEWDTPLFRMALEQFEQGLEHADVPELVAERLRFPERSTIVGVPVRMDDGSFRVFPAYRVQHSTVLGPTKGGLRYDVHVDLGECAALAMWMTWKCALLQLPYGGAKGGVRCNPREMSIDELQRLTRRFTIELLPVIGPEEDIPAPDMATNEQTMAWIMDTYSMQVGHAVPEIVTGKPISIGGSVFRREATGAGVVMVVERACQRLGWNLAEQRCVVQGFGNVGSVAANELASRGATVLAVSDISGGVYSRSGLDLAAVRAWIDQHGSLEGYPDGDHVSNPELLELPCDILVLAALEDQITAENAGRIDARMVAEGANGPTSVEADAILAERGIVVLPDILTNAGGVTVSYFEWVQDLGRLFWSAEEIRQKLADKLGDAFERVWALSEQLEITPRQAALVAAIREVAGSLTARGIYP
jgi:glutamate dehydrogenase (NAD(P)+)